MPPVGQTRTRSENTADIVRTHTHTRIHAHTQTQTPPTHKRTWTWGVTHVGLVAATLRWPLRVWYVSRLETDNFLPKMSPTCKQEPRTIRRRDACPRAHRCAHERVNTCGSTETRYNTHSWRKSTHIHTQHHLAVGLELRKGQRLAGQGLQVDEAAPDDEAQAGEARGQYPARHTCTHKHAQERTHSHKHTRAHTHSLTV